MLLPYEQPEALHTSGLRIPLGRYIEVLYNSKSFSLNGLVSYDSVSYEFSGNYNQQYFTGPLPKEFNGPEPAMTAATRRVCHGNGSDPLRYHDPVEYLMAGGQRVIAGWMTWIGDITVHRTPTTGSPSTYVTPSRLALPCFNYPLEWGLGPTTIKSGIKKGASALDPWLIFVQGTYGCGSPKPETYFGSMKNFESGSTNETTSKLVIDGEEFTFVESGPPSVTDGGFVSGEMTITRTAVW